jgi:hypothetical protein
MDILDIVGGDTILIASNYLPEDTTAGYSLIAGDFEIIARDLHLLATMGGARFPPIKFAYEALAWGTYISTWEASWDIVPQVDLPNFGLAIDTFRITGMVYADPSVAGGRNGPQAEANLRQFLHRLATRVDLGKLFVVQMAHAEKLSERTKFSRGPWLVRNSILPSCMRSEHHSHGQRWRPSLVFLRLKTRAKHIKALQMLRLNAENVERSGKYNKRHHNWF